MLEYKRQEKAAARCVGTSREASQIEKVSCASDARETSEPHVFLRRGDVGVAQRRRRKGCQWRASGATWVRAEREGANPKGGARSCLRQATSLRGREGGVAKVQPPEEGIGGGHRRSWGGERGDARGRTSPFPKRRPQGAASRGLRGRRQSARRKESALRYAIA